MSVREGATMLTLLWSIVMLARIATGRGLGDPEHYRRLARTAAATDLLIGGLLGATVGVLWTLADAVRGNYVGWSTTATSWIVVSVGAVLMSYLINPELWEEVWDAAQEELE